MSDGSSSGNSIVKTLKNEWALLWGAFQEEENSEKQEELLDDGKLEVMTLDQIREITRNLTEDRKKMNQKLESLSKEIELNSAKLEGLRLVGGAEDETLKRIHELNDLGQNMAEALAVLDKKLRDVRAKAEEIQEEA